MIPYLLSWVLLVIPALGRLQPMAKSTLVALLLFFTVLIGLRDEVGGDWFNYIRLMDMTIGIPLLDVFQAREPSYELLNWVSSNIGGGIFLVNTVCAFIFSLGLLVFALAQPRPWLALLLAFPYLVVVVAMGYTRQSAAIGLVLMALVALERDRLLPFVGLIAVAATFHRTSLIMLMLPALCLPITFRFGQLVRFAFLGAAAFGLYQTLLSSYIEDDVTNYIDAAMSSEGALIRVGLCFIPAALYLLKRKRFRLEGISMRVWTLMAALSVVALVALRLSTASTSIDRLALYLIPLQMFVGSRLPDSGVFGFSPQFWSQLLAIFSFVILWGWLSFAGHSEYWLPYDNLLFHI